MSIFTNPFFSVAGQIERLTNVKDTLVAAVTGKVQSNTGNAAVDSVLSTAASHPFQTAGVAAVVVNPSGALAVAKTTASYVGTAFVEAKPLTKVAVVGGTIFGGSAVLANPSLGQKVINAPANLASAGADLGTLSKEPSIESGIEFVRTHPYFTGAALTSALIALGFSASTISTILNTHAMNTNTNAMNKDGNVSSTGANYVPTNASPDSNGHDEDIAKANAKASQEIAESNNKANIEIAKIQAQSNKDTLDAQLKALSMQPAPVVSVKKAPAKKKAKPKPKPKKKTIKKKEKKKPWL